MHQTENQFRNSLNGKIFSELNDQLQNFIIFLNYSMPPKNDEIISVNIPNSKVPTITLINKNLGMIHAKRDVVLKIGNINKEFKISLKSGTGNSFHQEHWKYFEKLLDQMGATRKEILAFSNFIHSRAFNYIYFPKHQAERETMQNFLDKNNKKFLTHFIKSGYCTIEGHAEYIFHGKKDDITTDCSFGKIDDIIEKLCMTTGKLNDRLDTGPHVGGITFQRWNVTNKDKLNTVQFGKTNDKILNKMCLCNNNI